MLNSPVNESQRKAAKVAGAAYLLSFAVVIYVNFGIHGRLFVGDTAEIVKNILAHETLFRIGIVGDLTYCAAVVVLLAALYVILKPIGQTLALLAALWRLLWVVIWVIMSIELFEVLRIVHSPDPAEAGHIQAMVKFAAGSHPYDEYYVALLFGGIASTVCAYLWFKSRYIPRWLAFYGIVTSAFCVLCTLALYVDPNFENVVNLWLFDAPMGFFDIGLSLWLLIKGLRSSTVNASAQHA